MGGGDVGAFVLIEGRWQGLDRECFLAGVGAECDAVGDGGLLEGVQGLLFFARLGIVGEGEVGILSFAAVALEVAQSLQPFADAPGDAVDALTPPPARPEQRPASPSAWR